MVYSTNLCENARFASGNGLVFSFSIAIHQHCLPLCTRALVRFLSEFQSEETSNLFKLIGPFSELLWSFGLVWIFCNLCEKLTTAFEEVCGAFDLLDWYFYPPKMTKILPVMIMNAQRRVVVECFGKISCSLETFKAV